MEELVWFLSKAIQHKDKDKIAEYLRKIITQCYKIASEWNIDLIKD